MTKKRTKLAIGSLMIFAAALPCNARSAQPAETGTHLRLMGGRPVVDEVYINGQGPLRFLLDTGAATNQFDAALARKLGLEASFQVELATVGGTTRVQGGRVAQVKLGTAEASSQEFLFTTLDAIHTLSASVEGVLGEEFLSRFDYLLDFRNHRLAFGVQAPDGAHTSFRMIEGIPAIQTSEGELILDSGTDTTVLCRASSAGTGLQIRTASGFSGVSTGNIRLRIGEREIHPSQTAFAPRAAIAADGLLPASLFHAVFVSNSGRYSILD
jgi:hypothetical protein